MRQLNGFWKKTVIVLSISLILFQIYTVGFGLFQDIVQRTVHMTFVLPLLFILKPATKKAPKDRVPFYDVILALLSIVCCLYITLKSDRLIWDTLIWYSIFHKILAVLTGLLILEASRRSVGWAFAIMAAFFFFYAFYGELFPGIWGHRNFRFDVVFQTLYNTTTGVWGTMIGLSAVMLAMFSIFGAMLGKTGGATTFINIGQKVFGKSVGGQAKASLAAGGLFGMISGSALGNVVATGTFTIPMMRDAGYDKEWSAAIASVAAAGGAIMPPMMGAGAFIMAQLIGVPYLSIAVAAAVPAVLYYLGAIMSTHYLSKQRGILGHAEKISIAAREYVVIFVPIVIFVIYLIMGYAVANAAFFSTIGGIITYFICNIALRHPDQTEEDRTAKGMAKKTGSLLYDIAMTSAKDIVNTAGLLGGAQIIITLISLTGFAVKLSDIIVELGGNNLFLCMVLAMLVCIILGMGLPITASYVLGASILAPALTTLGLSPLVAHLFVFYFCCFSVLTPPVCGAVYLASGIANSKWFRTGVLSCLIALPGFIVPYTFVYNQALMLQGSLLDILICCLTAIVGVWSIGIGVAGYTDRNRNLFERAVFLVVGIMMVTPSYLFSAIGAAIFALMMINFKKIGRPAAKA